MRAEVHHPGLHVLLTVTDDRACPDKIPEHVMVETVPDESSSLCRAFLGHWKPDICVWHTGHLRPTLLSAARNEGLPMILVGAEETGFEEVRIPWRRRSDRVALNGFATIYANDADATRRLVRLGAEPERIEETGPLQEGGAALACDEEARVALSERLATRPVWLAAMVQPDEFRLVIEAHRQAIRVAHRLMLIVVPREPSDGERLVEMVAGAGLRLERWSDGGFPEETTQVLVADTYGEMGLWYRLAPVTFMGSSLTAGHGGRDPYEPAALGSAILYGPNVNRFIRAYSRFARAGAARMVKDAGSLSNAVLRLNAPDQSATMAQAAWEVATDGAEVTDRVLNTIEEILDARPIRDAGA